MKRILISIALFCLAGCGGMNIPRLESLTDFQPKVVSVIPDDGGVINPNDPIGLIFSVPVEPMTIDAKSLIITKIETKGGSEDGEDVVEDAVDGKVRGIDGVYGMSDDGTEVVFTSVSPYKAGNYYIIATNQVLSVDMLPLCQHPGRAKSPFVSRFAVGGGDAAYGSSPSAEDNDGADTPVGEGGMVVRDRPDSLMINEILYDVPGSDTDGDVFIELFGDAGGDISDYKIYLVNGEDGVIKDTIKIPENSVISEDGVFLIADAKTGKSGVSDVAGADFIDNFDPQNGPDCVQLVDESDALLDAVGYGEPIVETAENGQACFEGTPAPKVSSGKSLSRTGGQDTGDNAVDFGVLDAPSPGLL